MSGDTKRLETLAREVLHNFDLITAAAEQRLREKNPGLEAMAAINQATAEKVLDNLRASQSSREIDCRRLMRDPATARLVIVDEDNKREVLYVSPAGTVDPLPFKFCSYLSPKGSLASYRVGEYKAIRLPDGVKYFEVLEKTTFAPVLSGGEWDARPAIDHYKAGPPLTIKSLREVLSRYGVDEGDLDELERQLAAADEVDNIVRGLQRSVLTAMQMRVQPLLDEYQSEIFRLPLDSRLAVFGPPGSGKTTTLIKRLRQKLDFSFLDDLERELVEAPAASGLDHAHSWLMFTPTRLLKDYVKAAFNREDVPVAEERIQTWDDYRHSVARNTLPILPAGNRKGMIVRQGTGILQADTALNQIPWFEEFMGFQQELFLKELTDAASRLATSEEPRISVLGRRIMTAIERNQDRPGSVISELSGLLQDLQRLVSASRNETRQRFRKMLGLEVRKDSGFLDDLAQFLTTLTLHNEEDLDDTDDDDEDDLLVPQQGRRAAEAAFLGAMRAKAVSEISRRAPARTSRNALVLDWLEKRGIELPPLAETGAGILLLRSMTRLSKAPSEFITKIPARYRRFRRDALAGDRWYGSLLGPADVDPLEVDVVLLAMLRTARSMGRDRELLRRLGDRVPAILDDVARLCRNQVLVDEATDFSPIQLACMAALVDPRTNSFFAIGDFNQRLTRWGTRSKEELQWLFPDIDIKEVDIVYRQSRKLNEFAHALAPSQDMEDKAELPEFLENDGVPPVLGMALVTAEEKAAWLAARIREIEQFTQPLPSIAVLVNHERELQVLADALNEALADQAIRAVPCPKGQAIGPDNDVRIFEVQHIKGLEFEGVFFMGVDRLAIEEPDLFERFIYVGATRAATFLGLTCSGDHLPESLEPVQGLLHKNW